MADGDSAPSEGARSFSRFFEKLGYGQAERDASRALFELGQDLREHWLERGETGKGELGIKVKFAIDADGVLKVGYDVASKSPAKPKPGSICWLTKDGNLTYQDPKQTELEFGVREVPNAKTETRDVSETRQQGGA